MTTPSNANGHNDVQVLDNQVTPDLFELVRRLIPAITHVSYDQFAAMRTLPPSGIRVTLSRVTVRGRHGFNPHMSMVGQPWTTPPGFSFHAQTGRPLFSWEIESGPMYSASLPMLFDTTSGARIRPDILTSPAIEHFLSHVFRILGVYEFDDVIDAEEVVPIAVEVTPYQAPFDASTAYPFPTHNVLPVPTPPVYTSAYPGGPMVPQIDALLTRLVAQLPLPANDDGSAILVVAHHLQSIIDGVEAGELRDEIIDMVTLAYHPDTIQGEIDADNGILYEFQGDTGPRTEIPFAPTPPPFGVDDDMPDLEPFVDEIYEVHIPFLVPHQIFAAPDMVLEEIRTLAPLDLRTDHRCLGDDNCRVYAMLARCDILDDERQLLFDEHERYHAQLEFGDELLSHWATMVTYRFGYVLSVLITLYYVSA